MSHYTPEDPEGRATAMAAQRDDEAAANDDRDETRDVTGADETRDVTGADETRDVTGADEDADPDVVVLPDEDMGVLEDERIGFVRSGADTPAADRPAADRPAAETDRLMAGAGADQYAVPQTADMRHGRHAEPGLADRPDAASPGTAAAAGPGSDDPDAASPGTAAAAGPGPDDPGAPAVAKPAVRNAELQERWLAIQSDFVDDPRRSVSAAAELVTQAIETLVAEIKERDASLRGTWDSADADTEVLRNALRDYRGFLDRIVAL